MLFFCVISKGRELALPVVGAVVPGVGAGGVLNDDGITGAEVVEKPPGRVEVLLTT